MSADLQREDCGCITDTDLGIAVSFCKAHDRRTRQAKLGAALAGLAVWLDEAAKARDPEHLSRALGQAADEALKASKAVVAPDPNDAG